MLENQGLLAIAFFEATAFVILLALFFLLRRDNPSTGYRLWIAGWACLTISSVCELAFAQWESPGARLAQIAGHTAALLLFLGSVLRLTRAKGSRRLPGFPLGAAAVMAVTYVERGEGARLGPMMWGTAEVWCAVCLLCGWLLWRWSRTNGRHGAQLLSGAFLVAGLNGVDRVLWAQHPLQLLRVTFDHLMLVVLGVAMVVLVQEEARSRAEELNNKMRRLTMLTAASTQTMSVKEVLDRVLVELAESLGVTHGLVRLLEGEKENAKLVVRASVGFEPKYLARNHAVPANEPWAQRVLQSSPVVVKFDEEQDEHERERMAETGVREIISLLLPGKEGPLGIMAMGSPQGVAFQADEIAYLTNIANLLGLTLRNVKLFEQVSIVQKQWAYTFDSIGDPILVHDKEFRIVRSNQRLCQLLGRVTDTLAGRGVSEVLGRKGTNYEHCPYCEGIAGEGDDPDPWLAGYFLASNSTFADPAGRELGTVHVLKDITERKRAEEKYKTLVANVQEGVFISTPQGRFLDFNEAFLRIAGYDSREELLGIDIAKTLFVTPSDRERLKKLLHEHGSVADFEFEMRRKDGETRTVMESSTAVRDAAGNVTAYQGFALDITERKRAEREIRRRNRELLVLNSIAQTLTESMDLSDSLQRTLRQLAELFKLDTSSLYLFQDGEKTLKRVAVVGHRSEYMGQFPVVQVQPELLHHIKAVHAKFLSTQGLPLPASIREVQRKEGVIAAYVVILWSKDRVIGGLVVGSRQAREFSPADVNLLIAVGSQIASAIERSLLYEETRQAYENLRRTQEQLLHSEKMAAVGQLISGVAHELNNPLTAILGYSQLLTASGQIGPQGLEYSEKLYKQAQRTHRIVQNLLSFARQHKPERVPANLNQVLEDTLALRDYDLRMSNVRVHLDLAADLPMTAADPHQFQQVFLNLVNNAVDAILEKSGEGDLWVRTGTADGKLFIEFVDSGPGVHDPSRVFDPFYTTKPVGKGTGLGLSICYGIVTEHGGTIRVQNDAPRGAAFTIELPHHEAKTEPGTSGEGPVAPAKAGRVLLVDSDESVLEVVGEILRGKRHQVSSARTAEEAKVLMARENFDVVVADVQVMRRENGGSLGTWLGGNKPELAERVVLMRAGAPGAEEEETAGKAPLLQKPFKAADLNAAVEAMLGQIYAVSVD